MRFFFACCLSSAKTAGKKMLRQEVVDVQQPPQENARELE